MVEYPVIFKIIDLEAEIGRHPRVPRLALSARTVVGKVHVWLGWAEVDTDDLDFQ